MWVVASSLSTWGGLPSLYPLSPFVGGPVVWWGLMSWSMWGLPAVVVTQHEGCSWHCSQGCHGCHRHGAAIAIVIVAGMPTSLNEGRGNVALGHLHLVQVAMQQGQWWASRRLMLDGVYMCCDDGSGVLSTLRWMLLVP